MKKDPMDPYRFFLKDTVRKSIDFSETDQSRGVEPPPIEKPFPEDARRIDLVRHGKEMGIPPCDLAGAIGNRRSRRAYLREALSLEEVSFLLWATQGVSRKIDAGHAYRTVPSAGCRHALETYLCVLNVEGLEAGVYRYLPLEHQILFEAPAETLAPRLVRAVFGQPYPGSAAVTFIWTAIPYRMEWRYGIAAHKVIALDAGHVCQNLYLACEAIGAGTCAIAAYDQEEIDRMLGLDGTDEFTVYLATVGRVRKRADRG